MRITYTLGDGIDRHMEVDDDSDIARMIRGDVGAYSIYEPSIEEFIFDEPEPPNLVVVNYGIDKFGGIRDSDENWAVDAFGSLTDYGKKILSEWPEHPALQDYIQPSKPVKYYADGFVFNEKGEVVATYEQEEE